VVLLLFAAAREAAGTGRERVQAGTVGQVLEAACERHGEQFAAVLERSRIWVNGEPAEADHILSEGDEVAVLPPVSGGSGDLPW
jgi:molybdopterin synthase sulfur carrier subunit